MSGRRYEVRKNHLVLAVARGESVAAWGRVNHVPESTVYRWARSPEVRRAVEAARRRVIDRAADILAWRDDRLAEQIATIARNATSQPMRLQACRALLSDMRVSRFRELERRLARVEKRVFGQAESAVRGSELADAGKATERKQRASRRDVRFSLPLDPEGSRPTCAQVETRDSGDMENR
jgi:hypothetical protein